MEKKNASRFKGKLVEMVNKWLIITKCDDSFISPKTRQILLHWGSELTEKIFLPIQQFNWKIYFSLV